MSISQVLPRTVLFVSVFFLAPALGAGAAETAMPMTPTTLKGGEVISVAEAKQLLDQGGSEFFDTRPATEYGSGHIPGAKRLGYEEKSGRTFDFDPSLDRVDLGELPANKGKTVVLYCDGDGWSSYKAAVIAINAGHRDVRWLREGFGAWQAAQYPVE